MEVLQQNDQTPRAAKRQRHWLVALPLQLGAWGLFAYTVLLAGLSLAWALMEHGIYGPWWIGFSDIFALYLFLPLPLLLLLSIFSRMWPLRSAAGLMLLLFVLQFGATLLPQAAPPATPGQALRVASLNQLYSNRRIDDILAKVEESQADIIAFQELSIPVAEALETRLSERYPYQYLLPLSRSYGLGIISRYPIINRGPLTAVSSQRVVVDVAGTAVTVMNVHLPSPRVSYQQIARRVFWVNNYDTDRRDRVEPLLLRSIDTISGPLVVLGDFNTAEREALYSKLAERMTDSYRATNWGFGATFPTFGRGYRNTPPLVRIDYVWSRDGITPTSAWINCRYIGSDHCMVAADLLINTTTADTDQTRPEGRWLPW
jgi:endonuclease/exonuclease/phosphatase (EEP) superfamily protein YafD